MGFCTECGRQRTGSGQFCAGCGAQFSDAADATPLADRPQAGPAPAEQTADGPVPADQNTADPVPAVEAPVEPVPRLATTVEPVPRVETTVEPVRSADEPPDWADPKAEPELTRWDTHWYQPDPSPVPRPSAAPPETPPSAPTPQASPSGPPAYGPPSYGQGGHGARSSGWGAFGPSHAQGSPGQAPAGQGAYGQPPYQPPPHVPGTPGTPPLRRGQTAFLITLLVVVLLAVGGGAYVLVSRYAGHKTAAPPSPSTGPTTAATTAASTPTPSSTASPTVPPSSAVSVAPGVTANPAEPAIAAFLDRYFAAINNHDYATFSSLLDPQVRSEDTQSHFDTGYATTEDSAETLTSITDTGGGGEAAAVTFTSHQNPADSPSKTACTSWTITLYLQPNGSSYLIGHAPPGYHAVYAAC